MSIKQATPTEDEYLWKIIDWCSFEMAGHSIACPAGLRDGL